MTVDVDISGATTLGAPLSWRSLPSNPEHQQTTLIICSSFLALWTFLFFVGCYHHPIPASYKKKMSDYDKMIWRFRVINAYHGASATLLSMYWHYAYFTTEYSR